MPRIFTPRASRVLSAVCCGLLLLLLPSLQAYPYEFDFSVVRNDQSPRALQTSGGNLPDLGPPTQNCDTVGGTRFMCLLHQKVGFEEDYMDLNITIECYLDQSMGFDYRRAQGCTCSTLLTPSNTSRLSKTCPCLVCPKDFGSSSVSIDCSYLIPNATEVSDVPSMIPTPASSTEGGGGGGIPLPPSLAPQFAPSSAQTTRRLQQGTPAPSTGQVVTTGLPTPASSIASASPVAAAASSSPSRGGAITTDAPSPPGSGATTGNPSSAGSIPASTPAPSAAGTAASSSMVPSTSMAPSEGPVPDPYIFQTCVSVDCYANCNGTCSLGCDNPTAVSKCAFCSGAEGQPTPAPTGEGNGNGGVPTIGTSAAGSIVSSQLWSKIVAAGAASLVLLAGAL